MHLFCTLRFARCLANRLAYRTSAAGAPSEVCSRRSRSRFGIRAPVFGGPETAATSFDFLALGEGGGVPVASRIARRALSEPFSMKLASGVRARSIHSPAIGSDRLTSPGRLRRRPKALPGYEGCGRCLQPPVRVNPMALLGTWKTTLPRGRPSLRRADRPGRPEVVLNRRCAPTFGLLRTGLPSNPPETVRQPRHGRLGPQSIR